ncbi:hypothetical protein EBR43_06840 [bacterium]|nr:hypothetical protein [bacterium]
MSLKKIFIIQLVLMPYQMLYASELALGGIASNIQDQFGAISLLITAAAYLSGTALIVGGLMKLKTHRDAPQQTPLGVPLTMMSVGALLIYLQNSVSMIGGTFFPSASTAGISGFSMLTI